MYLSMADLPADCLLADQVGHVRMIFLPYRAGHPDLGAPAGGIRPPIARANARLTRAAKGKRAPGVTRSRA
jgi:hypothetical protein